MQTEISPLASYIDDFMKLLPRLSAMREGIELYGATNFSPFSVFSPDENTLSRVIAELFDPAGSHGQGLLFLNSLLSAIGIPRLNRLDSVKVRREVLTRAQRRIDIVIETSRYVVGIENKPWAAQQKNQLNDYLQELKADLRGRKPILVFLSDQAAQSAVDEVIRVPYRQSGTLGPSLYNILDGAVAEIKANAPRAFVTDFLRYIDIEFGDKYVDTATDKPFLDAVSAEFDDLQRRKAVASVLLSQEMLHCRILDEIGDHILSEVRKIRSDFEVACPIEGVEPRLSECLWGRWVPLGIFRPSWPANCHVAIEAGAGWVDGIMYGVRCPDEHKLPDADKHFSSAARERLKDMTALVPGGKKSNYWPWYKYLSEGYWGQEFCARLVLESPTGAVKDHPEIQDITQHIVEMALQVDRLLEVEPLRASRDH